jgi:hypothetical protein
LALALEYAPALDSRAEWGWGSGWVTAWLMGLASPYGLPQPALGPEPLDLEMGFRLEQWRWAKGWVVKWMLDWPQVER